MEEKIILISITEDSIRQIVGDVIKEAFSEFQLQQPQQSKVVDLNGLLNERPEVGSKSTIYKKASLGLIPHAKNGKKLYFDLQEIDEWLLANKVNAIHSSTDSHQPTGKKRK